MNNSKLSLGRAWKYCAVAACKSVVCAVLVVGMVVLSIGSEVSAANSFSNGVVRIEDPWQSDCLINELQYLVRENYQTSITELYITAAGTLSGIDLYYISAINSLKVLKTSENVKFGSINYSNLMFSEHQSIREVSLQNLTCIGGYAFEGCTALTTVNLPNLTSIEGGAFRDCTALTSIDLPKLTHIEGLAFEYCTSLITVNLPKLTSIGGAFRGCTALISINLPVLESISEWAFDECTALTTVDLPELTVIGNSAFGGCTALKSIYLPKLTSIEGSAFGGCTALTSIDLPELTSIGGGEYGGSAFGGCTALTSIDLPKLTSIRGAAFGDCTALTSIDLPELTSIGGGGYGGNAFEDCTALTTVNLPELTSIEGSAFGGCTSLISIDLPVLESIVGSIFSDAFENCIALTTVNLPELTSIEGSAFGGCTSLESIDLPLLENILEAAFINCTALTIVSLPELKSIEGSAFYGCISLSSINLPELTSIGGSAFYGCTSLESIDLPLLENILGTAFINCTALTIVSLPELKSIEDSAFSGCASLISVDLPVLESFLEAEYSSAFRFCTALTSVSLPIVSGGSLDKIYISSSVTDVYASSALEDALKDHYSNSLYDNLIVWEWNYENIYDANGHVVGSERTTPKVYTTIYLSSDSDPDPNPDSEEKPTTVNTKNEGCPLCALGNPINIGTGNKFQEEKDYQGAEHTGLELIRYYNSQGDGGSNFGMKWTSTWHRLFAYDNADDDEQVYISRADGKTYSFTKNDSGAWESGPDDLVQLTGSDSTGWALVLTDDSTERYSPEGQLQTITTRAGRVTSLTYDAQGNLTTITGPFGHQLHFAYGDTGYISQVTAPDGDVYAYAHDSNGNLISVTYPDGAQRQYLYENTTYPNALTGIIDANGSRFATYTYDDQGRVIETKHAGDADITSVTYGNNTASVTLPSGGQRDISFETVFGQVKPTTVDNSSCNCGARAYEYDAATGLLASRTDNNGSLTTYIRNERGLETSRTEAAGTDEARTITTEWHASFRLPTKITDGTRVTTFSYDQTGNLLSKIISGDGETRSWTYSYNAYGQIVQIDGPRTDVADVTRFAYDAQGNLLTVTNALGHQTTYNQYDANGNLLQVTDPNGLVTTYRYDERNRLIEQNIGGEITRYEFDPVGLLTKLNLPDSSYISYAYDAAHRLTSVSDTEGNSINYQLDEAGNILKETVTDDAGSLVRTAQHAYDDLNRVTQDMNAGGDAAQYSYDANGNVIGVTDEVELTSQYAFDAFNRLIQAVNPATYQTHLEYNRYDEVTEATDPRNLKTTYSYDGLGNRLAVNSPDSGLSSYEYDAAGNVVAVTNAKEETRQMTYDALNRLVSVQYVRGKTTTYGYDEGENGIGLMTSLRMSNNSSSTDFDYDQHGRLIQKEVVIGPKSLITGYSYNDVGQLVGITYPSGAAVSYQYNSQTGKLSGIKVNGQTLVNNMAYEPFWAIKGWSTGNGSTMLRTFNTDGFLTKQEQSGDSLEWSYDAAGKLVGVNDNEQQGSFSYYDDGALLSREFGNLYDIYTLDENHNRSYDGGLGNYSLYEIADDSNQILSTTPVLDYVIDNDAASALMYSATGNLIQNANFIMGYDETERMYIAAARKGKDFTLYFYNGLGERTYKIGASGSGRVLYAYDQNQRIIGEYQQARNSTDILASTETIYMPDVSGYGARDGYMPIGVLKDGQLYFVTSGQLGEPRRITDQSGQLVWSWEHDAFGKGEPDQRPTGASKNFVYNNRFPGQTYDAETGFFYNLNRYYDPNTGRYTRPDPIGLAGGMNPYVYVGGDPVNSVDPEGLNPILPLVVTAVGVYSFAHDIFSGISDGLKATEMPTDPFIKPLSFDSKMSVMWDIYSKGSFSLADIAKSSVDVHNVAQYLTFRQKLMNAMDNPCDSDIIFPSQEIFKEFELEKRMGKNYYEAHSWFTSMRVLCGKASVVIPIPGLIVR